MAKELNHLERIAVKQVERQRKNFDSISDEDLQSRKDFVRTTRRTLRDIKETMTGAATKAKMTQDKQSLLGIGRNDVGGSEGSSSKWGGGASNASGLSNSEFLTSERSQQGALMEKQDEMLDVLSSHVVQLNAMGTEIGTELDDQKRLLEDFDGELTKTQQRMEKVIGKMQDLLQTSNNGTLCLIVVLVIIAAVEFLLIMYT